MVSKEDKINIMESYFPKCPICKADANYEILGFMGVFIRCKSCKADWNSNDIGDKEIKLLELMKAGKNGKAKPLMGQKMPIDFWQSFDLEQYDPNMESEIIKLTNVATFAQKEESDEAIKKLREIGKPAIDILNKLIVDTSGSKDYAGLKAAWVLNSLGDQNAGDVLIRVSKESVSDSTRYLTVTLLAFAEEKDKSGRFIEPLIRVLKEDKNPNIRSHAALSLAFQKGDSRVLEALVQALDDREQLFVDIEQKTTRAWNDVSDQVALSLIKVAPTDDTALKAVFPHILIWKKQIAIDSVKQIGRPAVKHLIENLNSTDEQRKKLTVICLGELGDIEALKPLVDMLNDSSYETRKEVIGALKNLGNPAQEALIEALNDKEYNIRQLAALALGDIGDKRALESLKKATEDRNWFVRSAAKGSIKIIQKR